MTSLTVFLMHSIGCLPLQKSTIKYFWAWFNSFFNYTIARACFPPHLQSKSVCYGLALGYVWWSVEINPKSQMRLSFGSKEESFRARLSLNKQFELLIFFFYSSPQFFLASLCFTLSCNPAADQGGLGGNIRWFQLVAPPPGKSTCYDHMLPRLY